MMRLALRGRVLRTHVDSPTYATSYFDPRGAQDLYYPVPAAPYLKLSAVHDEVTTLCAKFTPYR